MFSSSLAERRAMCMGEEAYLHWSRSIFSKFGYEKFSELREELSRRKSCAQIENDKAASLRTRK